MKTHWKKTIDKDWIGTYVLPEEQPIVVKLISVKHQEVKVKGVKGMYKVAYFAPNPHFNKPMLLSANINLERLTKLTGTPYLEDWINLDLMVTLQQEMDKAFGGGKDWALRIAEKAPVIKTVDDYKAEGDTLRNAKNTDELKIAFLALTVEQQALFTPLKNELKTKL